MIRSLQRRFVIAAMIAITGLILLLLGAINAANLVLISQRVDRTLELLCDTVGDTGSPPPMPKPAQTADHSPSERIITTRTITTPLYPQTSLWYASGQIGNLYS